jgi:hypothetical protein
MRLRLQIGLAATTLAILVAQAPEAGGRQKWTPPLYLVRSVYVAPIEGYRSPPERLGEALEKELADAGFTIERDAANADATLGGSWGLQTILNGDERDHPVSAFDLRLESQNGRVYWHEVVKITESSPDKETTLYQSKRIVTRIVAAWNRSARRAEETVRLKRYNGAS